MLEKQNKSLREAMKKSGIPQWKIAEIYGITEYNFSKLLRKRLSDEEVKQIHNIINSFKRNEKGAN
jgi:predicted XRE-type DNA-binding protein